INSFEILTLGHPFNNFTLTANPVRTMNVVKEIQRLNAREASLSTSHSQTGSWHEQYKDSAHIFAGGLPYNLTEGDVICVFSQFGEIAGINLVRDKDTGKSKGFAFLKYVDQRSTILAVDNLNSAQIGGRTIRVDHVQNYKVPKVFDADGNEIEPDEDMVNNAVPKPVQAAPLNCSSTLFAEDSDEDASSESEVDDTGIDLDDPMREYLLKKRKKEARKAKRKAEKEAGHGGRSESKAERRARKEQKRAAKKDKESKKTSDKGDKTKLVHGDEDAEEKGSQKEEQRTKDKDDDKDKDIGDKKSEDSNNNNNSSSVKDMETSTVNKTTAHTTSRKSRSRSPIAKRSSSPAHRDRSRSTDRYKPSSSSYSYRHTTSRSRERRRAGDEDDYKTRRDGSRDDHRRSYRDSGSNSRDHSRYSSSRRRSPSPYSRRGGYDSRASRYTRIHSRSRSRSPRGRRISPERRRRSRSRSPRRP
ncbi:hypothetical protein BGZ72_001143, partial [Mortierella alpina]